MYKILNKLSYFIKNVSIVVLMICAGIILTGCDDSKEIMINEETIEESYEYTENKNHIYVYLSGEVESPGVYKLENEARLYQAIELAGGMTKNAQKEYLNLAETVYDGQQIHILSKKEYKKSQEQDTDIVQNTDSDNALININTATPEELQSLSGVGETRAKAIIEYREKNGKFQTIEDIKNVSGIGDSTFENIQNDITVN